MTPKERAAMQAAWVWMDWYSSNNGTLEPVDFNETITALQEALEQPDEIDWIETNKALANEIIELQKQAEQEPVGRWNWNAAKFEWLTKFDYHKHHMTPLYAAPQPVMQEPVCCDKCGSKLGTTVVPCDCAAPVQQVTRADLKAAFKEGFERAADLYAPNDGQEPYAYEVWDVQDQSFTMIYATQLKEFHWIEPENIARVLYAAPVRTKDLTDDEIDSVMWIGGLTEKNIRKFARAVIAADREKNK